MIQRSIYAKKYASAHDRFLKPVIMNFFEREFPGMFGPIVRENIASALIDLFNQQCPETSRLKHGQILWNALDKTTRADWKGRKYVPVVLSMVTKDEIKDFEKGVSIRTIRKKTMARLIREAYDQGGILSTRDLSQMLVCDGSHLSEQRIEYEKENKTVLPHTGVMHDMGTTVTHKVMIVNKYIKERKDPLTIARETNHSPRSVDRYLKDFQRVKTLANENKDIEFINHTTNISKHVVKQYLQIINDK